MDAAEMARLEAKLDTIILMLSRQMPANDPLAMRTSELGRLTTKQHAALQMLFNGKSNREIAQRMGVTENTAKVYVRAIAAKVGVTTRSQIVMRLLNEYEKIPEEDYRVLSGGLPKNWDAMWTDPDPHSGLYTKGS